MIENRARVKGDTATNVTKAATVETGSGPGAYLHRRGEVIQIDTRSGEYLSRSRSSPAEMIRIKRSIDLYCLFLSFWYWSCFRVGPLFDLDEQRKRSEYTWKHRNSFDHNTSGHEYQKYRVNYWHPEHYFRCFGFRLKSRLEGMMVNSGGEYSLSPEWPWMRLGFAVEGHRNTTFYHPGRIWFERTADKLEEQGLIDREAFKEIGKVTLIIGLLTVLKRAAAGWKVSLSWYLWNIYKCRRTRHYR